MIKLNKYKLFDWTIQMFKCLEFKTEKKYTITMHTITYKSKAHFNCASSRLQ